MLTAVTSALTTVVGWVGTMINALVGSGETAGQLSELLPIFAVGIAASAMFLAVKGIRSLAWGA